MLSQLKIKIKHKKYSFSYLSLPSQLPIDYNHYNYTNCYDIVSNTVPTINFMLFSL